jgi:O-antigen ligase/tetratricopeptide (TPR) repeat protein
MDLVGHYITVAEFFFRGADAFVASFFLYILLAIWKLRERTHFRTTTADLLILVFLAIQEFPRSGIYVGNQQRYSLQVATAVMCYFSIRLFNWPLKYFKEVCALGAILSSLIACFQLAIVASYIRAAHAVGFAHVEDIRGSMPNLGASMRTDTLLLLLSLLPFSLVGSITPRYLSKYSYFSFFSIICSCAAIISGLSRGATLGLMFTLVLVVVFLLRYSEVPWKGFSQKFLVIIMGTLCALIAISAVGPAMRLLFVPNVTSIRSVEGRKELWKESLRVIQKRPVFGYGGFNGPIALDNDRGTTDRPFVSRVYNSELQISIQNGFAGLLTIMLVVVLTLSGAVSRIRHRGSKNDADYVRILTAGMLGVLIADFTSASLALSFGLQIVWFCQLAFLNNANTTTIGDRTAPLCDARRHSLVTFIVCGGLISIGVYILRYAVHIECSDRAYHAAQTAASNGRFSESIADLKFAKRQLPDDIVLKLAEGNILLNLWIQRQSEPTDECPLQFSGSQEDRSLVRVAYADFAQAEAIAPKDESIRSSIAWIDFCFGSLDKSVQEAEILTSHSGDATEVMRAGYILYKSGLRDRGMDAFVRALTISPSLLTSDAFEFLEPSQIRLITLLSLTKLETLQAVEPSPLNMARIAKLSLTLGNRSDAERNVKVALAQIPNLSAAWTLLGEIDELKGNPTGALSEYKRAIFLDKTSLSALNGRARLDNDALADRESDEILAWWQAPSEHDEDLFGLYHQFPISRLEVIPPQWQIRLRTTVDLSHLCDRFKARAAIAQEPIAFSVSKRFGDLGYPCE